MNTIVQTPTNNLDDSLTFYQKLGFKVISKENPVLVSDGKAVIEINPDRYARAGLKLYAESWADTAKKLEALTTVLKSDKGYTLSDTSGAWIYLIESGKGPDVELAENSFSVLGSYAGLSLETIGIAVSMEIWQLLDFSKSMGAIEQGWVSLANAEGVTVSLMTPNACAHLFFNPSLTYFNGKNNPAIIAKIRELGIPITEEITHFNKEGIADNIIIRDPGGYGFFIFND